MVTAKLFGLGLGSLLALDMATRATAGVYYFTCRYNNKGCGTATNASFHANMQNEVPIDTSTLNRCSVISMAHGDVAVKPICACSASGALVRMYTDNDKCTADTGNTVSDVSKPRGRRCL